MFCNYQFLLLGVDLSSECDLSSQNSICIIYKLLNPFYFVKLMSTSANAFTASKFQVFFIYDQASGKKCMLSHSVVDKLQLSQMK